MRLPSEKQVLTSNVTFASGGKGLVPSPPESVNVWSQVDRRLPPKRATIVAEDCKRCLCKVTPGVHQKRPPYDMAAVGWRFSSEVLNHVHDGDDQQKHHCQHDDDNQT